MPKNSAMTDLLDRLDRNARQFQMSYASANQLLDAAVAEAFPWVLALPVVRGKVPPMFRNALPKGAPVTLDKLERLATQLVAILAASYGPQPGQDDAGGADVAELAPKPQKSQANIYTFKER